MSNSGSLRLRLAVAASITISAALALAALGLYYRFQTHVEKLMTDEFNAHFEQLISIVRVDEEGNLYTDSELSDPRFYRQYGGLYWQIDVAGKESLRSRSLWDEMLHVPTPPEKDEDEHIHDVTGPNGTQVLMLEKLVKFEGQDGKPIPTVVSIGIDKSAIENATAGFSSDMKIGLPLLYLALLGASLAQIIIGLRPLQSMRNALADIRTDKSNRLQGSFPAEVQPMVSELNTLLEAREHQLARARKRAGNLAHGLKTPITVLQAIADDLVGRKQANLAREIRETTTDMSELVQRELMRARTSANNPYSTTEIVPIIERLTRALKHIRMEHPLAWEIEAKPDTRVPMDAGDVFELLGNLLDNAQKHAVTRVRIAADKVAITVEDDGPGVPPELRSEILKRGVKLDEHKSGSGLGLAIVQDLADAYGATLTLSESSMGGLAVRLAFRPSQDR